MQAPEGRPIRRSKRPCRIHLYGPAQPTGGGIARSVCRTCGVVSIDLTSVDIPERTTGLFDSRRSTLTRP